MGQGLGLAAISEARASACVSIYSRMFVTLPFRTVMAKTQWSSNVLFVALILPVAKPTTRTRSPWALNSGGSGYEVSTVSLAFSSKFSNPACPRCVPASGQSSPGMIHSISSADNASKPCLSRRPSAARKFFTTSTFFSMLIEISPFPLHQACHLIRRLGTILLGPNHTVDDRLLLFREATAPGSDLRHASIDGEIHTGDVRTFIGSKEHDCCRDFLGLASAAEWNLRSESSYR